MDRIDDILNNNRDSSIYLGDAESIDIDAQQMVDGLTSPSVGGQPFNAAAAVEEDEIIKTTRELLA